jgi:N-acetylglutamate synthase-like GNAT family acetyltransferase
MIREAKIEDIPAILKMVHESIRSCVQDHNRNESEIQIWLEKFNQSNLMLLMLYNDSWVYIEQSRIAGFLLVNDDGKILLNYIAPEMQQQGIGTALLVNICEKLKDKNVQQITLRSTHTALPFYQKQGFELAQHDEADMVNLIKYLV